MCKIPCLPLVLLCFSLPLAAQNVSDIVGDTFEETAGRGLAIRTRPAAVKVFIDGVERGETPFSLDALRAGTYSIVLNKEGCRERRFNITLSDNSRLAISIEMEAALGQALITLSRTAGSDALPFAPLLFSGALAGGMEIPPGGELLLALPEGFHRLTVRAFGWQEAGEAVLIRAGETSAVHFAMKPAVFALGKGTVSRRRFNPNNSGALGLAAFRFEVSGPGSGVLNIQDAGGTEVYRAPLGPFTGWLQEAVWNGRDSAGKALPEGVYTAHIEAAPDTGGEDSLSGSGYLALEIEINYAMNIFPLSMAGGLPGLVFAPVPATLPLGSFQIEGGILFGVFSAPEQSSGASAQRPFSRLPFQAGLRLSPLERLELAAVVNANPDFEGGSGWGFTGSLKYAVTDGGHLGLALSYTAAGAGGEAPLGTGRGGAFWLPLRLERGGFSLVFSPGTRWPGPDDPVPRLLLAAGALFKGPWFSAGFSLRPEFDFTRSGGEADNSFAGRVRFHTGVEAQFYPPPSNLVFSVLAGAWLRGGQAGSFGGISIGALY